MAEYKPPCDLPEYLELERELQGLLSAKKVDAWKEMVRGHAEADFYSFGRLVSSSGKIPAPGGEGRAIEHPYIYTGFRMVQRDPWDVIDVWPRGHWKSLTKTVNYSIWEFIRYGGLLCQCIISIERGLAKKHLSLLRVELESNPLYHILWPEIFFEKPRFQGRPWSDDDGLNCRTGVENGRAENNFEARGLDSQPTGAHFDRLYFDDCSHESTVGNISLVEQAKQNYQLWGGLENESAPGGPQRTHHGTFYEVGDLNYWIVEQDLARLRHRDCVVPSDDPQTIDIGGEGIYLSNERLRTKLAQMGENYASQMRGDPLKGRGTQLDPEDLRYYDPVRRIDIARRGYVYILVDPNGWNTSDQNDECAILVIALGSDRNVYIVDIWRGRPNPGERVDKIIDYHIKWFRPRGVWIEEIAAEADTYWINDRQESRNHRFDVRPIQVPRHIVDESTGRNRGLKKKERIYRSISPLLTEHRLWLPRELWGEVDGKRVELVRSFAELLGSFPVGRNVHQLAALSLLFCQGSHDKAAPDLIWPPVRTYGLGVDYDGNGKLLRFDEHPKPRHWMAA